MKVVNILAKERVKKAKNITYYFKANLGYDSNGKQIQKYISGFKTNMEVQEKYSKLILYEEDDIKIVEMNFKKYNAISKSQLSKFPLNKRKIKLSYYSLLNSFFNSKN